jgi:hypothetical protein
VYDTLTSNWVSLDITSVARVKQWTILETTLERKLYCITHDNKMWQMFGSEDSEVPELRVRGYVPQLTDTDHKSIQLRAMFTGGTEDGEAICREFVDDQEWTEDKINRTCIIKELKSSKAGINYPVRCPVIPGNKQHVENITFALSEGLTGKKISFILQWTNDSSLVELMFSDSEVQQDNSDVEKEKIYGDSTN